MHDLTPALVDVARAMRGIVSVYLFGSVAEGRAHAESDVDLGVLLDWKTYPNDRERFDCRVLLGTRFSDAARRDADVVILNDAPPQLGRAIMRSSATCSCSPPTSIRGCSACGRSSSQRVTGGDVSRRTLSGTPASSPAGPAASSLPVERSANPPATV